MRITNKRATFDYNIISKFEFGISFIGCEVKSIRVGKASIANTYLRHASDGCVYIYGMHISAYNESAYKGSKIDEYRPRAILLHKKEKNKIISFSKEAGKSVVPISLYFNKRGIAKLECAIVEGKTTYDKRRTIIAREWKRQKRIIM